MRGYLRKLHLKMYRKRNSSGELFKSHFLLRFLCHFILLSVKKS